MISILILIYFLNYISCHCHNVTDQFTCENTISACENQNSTCVWIEDDLEISTTSASGATKTISMTTPIPNTIESKWYYIF